MQLQPLESEANGGISVLAGTPVRALINDALKAQTGTPSQKQFKSILSPSLRLTCNGWSPKEFPFSSQTQVLGRPRAIDYFHQTSKTGIELELSNQTVLSHDLIKLEVAYRERRVALGVILTVSTATRKSLAWKCDNWYLTFESSQVWVNTLAKALTVPIVVLAF